MPKNTRIAEVATPIAIEREDRRSLLYGDINLNSVAAAGVGSSVYTADKGYMLWIVTASSVTTGGTVLVQGCWKDSGTTTDWYTVASISVTANGSYYAAVLEDEWHDYMRSNLSVRTDGTYTSRWLYVPRKDSR